MPISRAYEARRRTSVAAADDGGDGAAGLRPMRLQLQRLFGRDCQEGEARLNLCVPGGKETVRMLKALHEDLDKAPAATRARAASRCYTAPAETELTPGRSRDNPLAATFLSRRLLNSLVRKRKPGISSSIFGPWSRLRRRRFLRRIRPQRPRPCRPDHCDAWRIPHYRGRRASRCASVCATTFRCRRRRIRCSN